MSPEVWQDRLEFTTRRGKTDWLMLRNRATVGAGLVPAHRRFRPTSTISQGNHKGCPYKNRPNVEVEVPVLLSFYMNLNLLVQWDGLPADKDGFVPLSIAQFAL